MKRTFWKTLTIGFLALLVLSCRHKDVNPGISGTNCPLLSVSGPKGNVREYEWVANNLIRIYSRDSIPTTLLFRYNTRNFPEKMEIQTDNSAAKYVVTFTYDSKDKVTSTTTALSGIQIMKNEFLYSTNDHIASIQTTVELFGKKVSGKTRIVYDGDNVSRVYSSIDNEQESLAFTGEKYDEKNQFCPEVYRYAAMGFVGIANNFFSFFGKNNMLEGSIYDGKGRVDQKTTISYLYSNSGLPLQSETIIERNSIQTKETNNYVFACK